MSDEVKKIDEESSESGALTLVNADDLNKESLTLINQIIAEKDLEKTKDLTHLININQNKKTMIRIDKLSGLQDDLVDQFVRRIAEQDIERTKDLTHLFNINQNKKTMIRIDKLSGLQDNLVDQFVKRIAERPDQISTKELMDGLKIVQDIIERGQKQVEGVQQTPLIQFNQQNNSVNIGDGAPQLSKESRDKVKNAVLSLLSGLNTPAPIEVVQEEPPVIFDVTESVEIGEETDDRY